MLGGFFLLLIFTAGKIQILCLHAIGASLSASSQLLVFMYTPDYEEVGKNFA